MTNTIRKINNWSWDSRVKHNKAFLVWTDEVIRMYVTYIKWWSFLIEINPWNGKTGISICAKENESVTRHSTGFGKGTRKVCIYFTWRRGISARIRSVETDRLFKFVHELSSHPLALNNCSLRLVFSYLGHTHTCTSIACRKVLAILSLRHAL